MLEPLAIYFKKALPEKILRLARRFKSFDPSKPFKSKKSRISLGITLFMMIVLIFAGLFINEETNEKVETETKQEEIAPAFLVPELIGIQERILSGSQPRVAIILDDAGGNIPDYTAIYSIKQPITLSILPNLPRSNYVAWEAVHNGLEVLLHLPMEPLNGDLVRNGGDMILGSMPDDKIGSIVNDDLNSVKWMAGVNNHMGSRATQDKRVMNDIMKVIKDRNLFFVDSRTSNNSIAFETAKEDGVLSARNNIFLDTGTDRSSIESKLNELVSMAKLHGEAVGIGHATRKQTVDVLREFLPKYAESGIKFVYVSEIVR